MRQLFSPVLAGLLTGLLVAAGQTAAEASDRQTVRSALTTQRPAASAGSRVEMAFTDPQAPGAKPPSVDVVVIRSAPGTRFDHGALPVCSASDAELMARGDAACPASSRVQTGRMVLDTGSPLGPFRLIRFRTWTFNAASGFVSLGESEDLAFRGIVRSRSQGRTLVVDYTDAPAFGSLDSRSAMTAMITSGPALGSPRRPFMRTPPTCPRRGRWITQFTFIYHDGVRQTERTTARCRPARDPR